MLFRSDRKSTRLNSSHLVISYAVFCLKKKKKTRKHLKTQHIESGTADVRRQCSTYGFYCLRVLCFMILFFVFSVCVFFFFFFNDTAPTEIYTLSLHDALPISRWIAAAAPLCGPTGNGTRKRSA